MFSLFCSKSSLIQGFIFLLSTSDVTYVVSCVCHRRRLHSCQSQFPFLLLRFLQFPLLLLLFQFLRFLEFPPRFPFQFLRFLEFPPQFPFQFLLFLEFPPQFPFQFLLFPSSNISNIELYYQLKYSQMYTRLYISALSYA